MSASGDPYVGRRSFGVGDWEIFFGRHRECRELRALWQRDSVVILHGPAGCGKTSFLRAGVARMLTDDQEALWIGHTGLGTCFPQAALPDHNKYAMAVLSSWCPAESPTRLATLSLADFLSERALQSGSYSTSAPIFAVIDQLEEIFGDSRATRDREAFFDDLATAIRTVPQLKVLLAIRSEDLGELTPYEQRLSLNRQAFYHIAALGREAALEAVRGPMEKAGRPYAEGVAELLVNDLLTTGPRDFIDKPTRGFEATIEPVQLQVVCSDLRRALKWSDLPISLDSASVAGHVDRSLAGFCADVVADVAAEVGVGTWAVGDWVKRTFLAADGKRAHVPEGALAQVGLQLATARALLNQHLVTATSESGMRWYTLANDRLIAAIRELNEPAPSPSAPAFNALSHLGAAGSALAAGDVDRAERHAKDALKSAGGNLRLEADAYSLLGNAAYSRGRMDDAEKQYMQAAQLREELQDQQAVGTLLGAIGRIHAIRGRHAAALEELQSAVTRLPGDVVLQTELAKALSDAGQPQAAAAVFGTVLTIEPDSIEALSGRGQIQAEHGNAISALEDLQTLRRLRPSTVSQPELRSAYALALARTGRAEAAMREADAALASAPDNGIIFLRAARVAQAVGSQDRATELFRKAATAKNPALSSDQLSEAQRLTRRSV